MMMIMIMIMLIVLMQKMIHCLMLECSTSHCECGEGEERCRHETKRRKEAEKGGMFERNRCKFLKLTI